MNRINETTKDALNMVLQLRKLPDDASVAPEHLHGRLRSTLDEMISRGKGLDLKESDLADVTYALVAFADEVAQQKSGPIQEYWHLRPLQLYYFGENVAGDGFFERLERIIADPSRVEVLTLYHLCLALGFQGRFAVRGGELQLDVMRRRVREALGSMIAPEPVSRRHLPGRETLARHHFDYLLMWLGLFGVLFALCFFVVLRVALDDMVRDFDAAGSEVLRALAGPRGEQGEGA